MKCNITKLGVAAVILVASLFVTLKPGDVYAENPCEGHIFAVNIRNGEVTYADGVKQDTAIWEEDSKTLTLNNYSDGLICFDDYGEVNIHLKGENEVLGASNYGQIETYNTYRINIKGDGKLVLKRGSGINGDWYPTSANLNIEGGDVRVLNESSVYSCFLRVDAITGGNFYSECVATSGGQLSSFYQSGGTFEIKTNSSEGVCFESSFAIFKGGVASIECAGASAMTLDYWPFIESYIPELTVRTEDDVIWIDTMEDDIGIIPVPAHGAALFDGGDVTLKSDVAALVVYLDGEGEDAPSFDTEAYLAEKGKDYFITISDDLAVDPEEAVIDSISAISEDRIHGIVGYSTFTDGTGETSIFISSDRGVSTSSNVIKNLHIHKASVPVPDTDGSGEEEEEEEVPNTIDTKIVGLAFGVLLSIFAEGVIIADLYRRLSGYKKELSEGTENTEETDSTPKEV